MSVALFAQVKPDFSDDQQYTKKGDKYLLGGTSYEIAPPAHFQAWSNEESFVFIHPGAMSSMQIRFVEGVPYTFITSSITVESMKQQGAELVLAEEVKTNDGNSGIMYLLSYDITGDDNQIIHFERLMLLTGDYNTTVWIDANYPVQARTYLYNVMRESMLSIEKKD